MGDSLENDESLLMVEELEGGQENQPSKMLNDELPMEFSDINKSEDQLIMKGRSAFVPPSTDWQDL